MSHRHVITVYQTTDADFAWGGLSEEINAVIKHRAHVEIVAAAIEAQRRSTPPQEREAQAQARWASKSPLGYGWGV